MDTALPAVFSYWCEFSACSITGLCTHPGLCADASDLKTKALTLAAGAAVRHNHTPYDALLASGVDRADARLQIAGKVEEMLARWRKTDAAP